MSTTNGSTARTGHGGRVLVKDIGSTYYLVARVTQWSVNPTATEAAWADSDSRGFTNRRAGRRDCTGTLTGKLDKTYPAYKNILFATDDASPDNNDTVALALYEDGNEATPDTYWFFPRAVITSYTMTFDMDTRDPVEWSANFGSDGVFFKPGDADTVPSALETLVYADQDNYGS